MCVVRGDRTVGVVTGVRVDLVHSSTAVVQCVTMMPSHCRIANQLWT